MNPLPIAATFSKDPSFWGVDFHPMALTTGYGAMVHGDDGVWYLDWVSALGANILGYSNQEFTHRVRDQVLDGAGFSLPHILEGQVAEKLVTMLGNHVPGWSPDGLGMRFGKSGTDATTMAVRMARAVTDRQRIISHGYHGWMDWSVAKTPPAHGVVRKGSLYISDLPFNDIETLESLFVAEAGRAYNQVAAVIMEQPMDDPLLGYYDAVRRLCDEQGALLIIDEVVTWPRYGLGGACECYDIRPDIICIGKGLGNGMPISAIVGRRDLFDWFGRDDPVFVSSTHFGEAVSLAAADAVLGIWDESKVMDLWGIGEYLMTGLQSTGLKVVGHPPRSLNQFASKAERGYFILGMRDRGILMNRPNLPNLAHNQDDVAKTVVAARGIMAEMNDIDVVEAMRGRLPRVLFENR